MPRRLPTSPLLAALVLLALVLWLVLGDLQRFQSDAPEAEEATTPTLTRVEYQTLEAVSYPPQRTVQGQLEALREVELRSRYSGRVTARPVAQGSMVEAGTVLLELSRDALEAQLERAEDQLELARSELAGASSLRQRNLISQPELLRLQSNVSVAAAELAELRQSLTETRPEAPFDGVLDRLYVELGDVVQMGDSYARLVDDRRLKATGWVAQRDVFDLRPGLDTEIRLLDGSSLAGELTHVASRADDASRAFYIEAEFDNPERRRLAGASATLTIALPEREVHSLSPALLELDSEGQLRIKHLDNEDRVVSSSVELIAGQASVAYVAGLPDTVRLITLGGGFVTPGETVMAMPAGTDANTDEQETP